MIQDPLKSLFRHVHSFRRPFVPPPWRTADDRVRGGSSQSYLSVLPMNRVRFHGKLDIQTLGGAGFASQFNTAANFARSDSIVEAPDGARINDDWIVCDLSKYDGICIGYGQNDGKVYTFIIKDETPNSKREDGREKAGINWEIDIKAERNGGTVRRCWGDFKAFYRGKERNDAGQLRSNQVMEIGIMMRRCASPSE